ncbi:MAG: tetratricopeptide repeat protein [Phycisphaerae bacterium]
MSYLLESLGRGLLGQLLDAFRNQLPGSDDEPTSVLARRLADSPASTDLALRLAVGYLREQRLAEARVCFERARASDDQSAQALIGLACVFDELGRLDLAQRELLAARELDPLDPAISFAIALCHERDGDEPAANDEYGRAIELCPRLRNAHERRAALAVRRADWENAIVSYERLADLESGDLDVLITLGALLLAADQPAPAIERFQRALLIEPECTEEPIQLAEQFTEEGRLAEALRTLEKLVEKYPGVSEFRVHLADLHAKTGDDPAAVAGYRAAIELHPGFLEANVKLGTQHLRHGRYEDAAQAFNCAVEINDRLLLAFAGLSVAQARAGRRGESMETLGLAASLEPNSTLLFAEAARLHLRAVAAARQSDDNPPRPDAGDLIAEAHRRHRQALLTSPRRADLHYRLGVLQRHIGAFSEAMASYQRALDCNPSYVKPAIRLGLCLRERDRADEALAVLDRVFRHSRREIAAHHRLALLFSQRNQFDLALERFESSLPRELEADAFRANLTTALQSVGMVDRAAATWQAICETGDTLADSRDGARLEATQPADGEVF